MKNDGDESQGTLINDFKDIKFDDNDVLGTPLENINVYKALGISEGKYNKKIIRMKHASENQNDKSDEKIFSENSELKATLEEKIKEMNKLLRSNKEESKKDELVKKIALAQAFVNVATEDFDEFASYNEKVGNDLYPSKITRTELAYAEGASAGKNLGKAAGGIAGAVASIAKGVGHLGVSALKNTNRLTRAGGRVASGGVAIPTYEGVKRTAMAGSTVAALAVAAIPVVFKLVVMDAPRFALQKSIAAVPALVAGVCFTIPANLFTRPAESVAHNRYLSSTFGMLRRNAVTRVNGYFAENALNRLIRNSVDSIKGLTREESKALSDSIIKTRKIAFENLENARNGKGFKSSNEKSAKDALNKLTRELDKMGAKHQEIREFIGGIREAAKESDKYVAIQIASFTNKSAAEKGKAERDEKTKKIRIENDEKYGATSWFKYVNAAVETSVTVNGKGYGADAGLKSTKDFVNKGLNKAYEVNNDGFKRSANVMANVALPLLKTQDEYTRLTNLAKRVNNLALFQLEKHYKATRKDSSFGNGYKEYKEMKELMANGPLITINPATKSNDKIAEAENLKTQLRDLMDKKPNLVPEELKIPILYETGGLKMAAKAMSWVTDLVTLQKPVRGIKGLLERNVTKPLTKENLDAHNKASKTLKESDAGTNSLTSSQSESLKKELKIIEDKSVVRSAIAATKKDTLSNKSSSSRSGSSRSGSSSFGGR